MTKPACPKAEIPELASLGYTRLLWLPGMSSPPLVDRVPNFISKIVSLSLMNDSTDYPPVHLIHSFSQLLSSLPVLLAL